MWAARRGRHHEPGCSALVRMIVVAELSGASAAVEGNCSRTRSSTSLWRTNQWNEVVLVSIGAVVAARITRRCSLSMSNVQVRKLEGRAWSRRMPAASSIARTRSVSETESGAPYAGFPPMIWGMSRRRDGSILYPEFSRVRLLYFRHSKTSGRRSRLSGI